MYGEETWYCVTCSFLCNSTEPNQMQLFKKGRRWFYCLYNKNRIKYLCLPGKLWSLKVMVQIIPGVPKKGNSRFSLLDIQKYSITILISSDKTLKLVEEFWFYGHFSNYSHRQFSLHSRDISVRDNGFSDFHTLLPGTPLIRANNTKREPAVNSSRRFNKIRKWLCFKKWLQNQYYQTKSHDLFRRQCFMIYLMKSKYAYIFEYQSRGEGGGGGHPVLFET